jgi:Ion channel
MRAVFLVRAIGAWMSALEVRSIWRRPALWGICYFGCIPLFAAIYSWGVPGGFYAPYAKLEPFSSYDEATVSRALANPICRALMLSLAEPRRCYVNVREVDSENILLSIKVAATRFITPEIRNNLARSAKESSLRSDRPFLTIIDDKAPIIRRAKMSTRGKNSVFAKETFFEDVDEASILVSRGGFDKDGAGLDFSWDLLKNNSIWTNSPESRRYSMSYNCVLIRAVENKKGSWIWESLAKKHSRDQACLILNNDSDAFEIPLSSDAIQKLGTFARGRDGDPSAISGNYWRMLYFSTVTIATIGYGDIIPITNAARFWVALEAFLGLVFAGLFLSSLYDRVKTQD